MLCHAVDLEGMQQSLMGLHNLKTLYLSCFLLDAGLPELRLKELAKLHHVRLDNVFPIELLLPHGCQLDVRGQASVMDEVLLAPRKHMGQNMYSIKYLHSQGKAFEARHFFQIVYPDCRR